MVGEVEDSGTTSACAENTMRCGASGGRNRNYLRMRGEYGRGACAIVAPLELPPHARRIRRASSAARHRGGTTSACAENTSVPATIRP